MGGGRVLPDFALFAGRRLVTVFPRLISKEKAKERLRDNNTRFLRAQEQKKLHREHAPQMHQGTSTRRVLHFFYRGRVRGDGRGHGARLFGGRRHGNQGRRRDRLVAWLRRGRQGFAQRPEPGIAARVASGGQTGHTHGDDFRRNFAAHGVVPAEVWKEGSDNLNVLASNNDALCIPW